LNPALAPTPAKIHETYFMTILENICGLLKCLLVTKVKPLNNLPVITQRFPTNPGLISTNSGNWLLYGFSKTKSIAFA